MTSESLHQPGELVRAACSLRGTWPRIELSDPQSAHPFVGSYGRLRPREPGPCQQVGLPATPPPHQTPTNHPDQTQAKTPADAQTQEPARPQTQPQKKQQEQAKAQEQQPNQAPAHHSPQPTDDHHQPQEPEQCSPAEPPPQHQPHLKEHHPKEHHPKQHRQPNPPATPPPHQTPTNHPDQTQAKTPADAQTQEPARPQTQPQKKQQEQALLGVAGGCCSSRIEQRDPPRRVAPGRTRPIRTGSAGVDRKASCRKDRQPRLSSFRSGGRVLRHFRRLPAEVVLDES